MVLAGFIVTKITNKDGTVTEIKVPDDAKVEVTRDKKPDAPPKPKPATPKVNEELTNCSDEAVAELKGFRELVLVTLARLKGLSPKSIESIAAAFPELYRLMLIDLDLPPSFLGFLHATKLQWLQLESMPRIDDSCVESIAAIKTLNHLTLKECKVTPEGVKRLAAALPLCRIEWDGGVIEPTAK